MEKSPYSTIQKGERKDVMEAYIRRSESKGVNIRPRESLMLPTIEVVSKRMEEVSMSSRLTLVDRFANVWS